MGIFRSYLLLYSTFYIWTVIAALNPVTYDENRTCLNFTSSDDVLKVINGSWVELARNYNDFEENTCQGISFITNANYFMMKFKVDLDAKRFGIIQSNIPVIFINDDDPHTLSIVATDIENYVVLYACGSKNVSELVWVLVRREGIQIDLESILLNQPSQLLSLFTENACRSTSEEGTTTTKLSSTDTNTESTPNVTESEIYSETSPSSETTGVITTEITTEKTVVNTEASTISDPNSSSTSDPNSSSTSDEGTSDPNSSSTLDEGTTVNANSTDMTSETTVVNTEASTISDPNSSSTSDEGTTLNVNSTDTSSETSPVTVVTTTTTTTTDLPPLIPAFNYNDKRVFFISQLLIKLSE